MMGRKARVDTEERVGRTDVVRLRDTAGVPCGMGVEVTGYTVVDGFGIVPWATTDCTSGLAFFPDVLPLLYGSV